MKTFPLTVVDNFFDDIDEVIEYSRSIEYHLPENRIVPGFRSKKISDINYELCNFIANKISSLFYDCNTAVSIKMTSYFSKMIPYGGDKWNPKNLGIIHKDSDSICGGVIYLDKKYSKDSGTSIFLKDNFYVENNIETETFKKYHGDGIDDGYDDAMTETYKNFTETVRIQYHTNRMILFDSSVYHAQTTFGDDVNKPRYSICFFIEEINSRSGYPLLRV